MASRLLRRSSSQLRACLPSNVPSTASQPHHSRPFSHRQHSGHPITDVKALSHDSSFSWPDTRLGPLEPKDKRFPFPGLVGSSTRPAATRQLRPTLGAPCYEADVLTAELAHERQSSALEQFVTVQRQLEEEQATPPPQASLASLPPGAFNQFTCAAHECPHFLFADFCDMFPNYHMATRVLTVITLSHKGQGMLERDGELRKRDEGVERSEEMRERDKGMGEKDEGVEGRKSMDSKVQLMEAFIDAATDICEVLHEAGFWADFIDPTSGRPYVGNQPMVAAGFVADERYRRLGFEIKTSGGCRVLQHHVWGSRPYVGCLFTSTPLTHPLISDIVRRDETPAQTAHAANDATN